MRIDWRFCSLVSFAFAVTGCNGNVVSRTTPASDWTRTSTQSRQLASLADPLITSFLDVHDFGGAGDGSLPYAGVDLDTKGHLYGTTVSGGANGYGAVYEMTPNPNGKWPYRLLYSFKGGSADGAYPYGIAVSDPGAPADRFGTTEAGGSAGFGTVFRIGVKGTKVTESIVYSFQGAADGASPTGSLLIDKSGNIYGLTTAGGTGACTGGCGTAFKLVPPYGQSNETVIHAFLSGSDGNYPGAGLIADTNGDLFGTTEAGGGSANCENGGCGTVFELTPSGSGYAETTLYSFTGSPDGSAPAGDLTIDKSGNLYGTTSLGGPNAGTVFELLRGKSAISLRPNGDVTYTEKILYGFQPGTDGQEPLACLGFDKRGNIYGTTYAGGASSLGTIFELVPNGSGGWNESIVHTFLGGKTDGASPSSGLLLTASGGFVVTTQAGGSHGNGAAEAASFKSSRSNAQRCKH